MPWWKKPKSKTNKKPQQRLTDWGIQHKITNNIMAHLTEVQTIEAVNNQVSSPKIWGSATTSVDVGDIIHSPFMPVMRVMDKQKDNVGTWLLVEPTNAAYPREWIEVEDEIQQPAAAKPLSRNIEIQTIEAFGVSYTEYRYEAELPEDEPIVTSLTCGQCDYYKSGKTLSQGSCTLLEKARCSGDLACPQLAITAPF